MALITLPPSALITAAVTADGRTVVVLRGEADVANRPVLCDVLSRVIALQVGDVVIDLGEVTFIDTAAVRAMAIGHELLDGQGRRLTFRSPSRLAAQVIDMFGLTDLIRSQEEVRSVKVGV